MLPVINHGIKPGMAVCWRIQLTIFLVSSSSPPPPSSIDHETEVLSGQKLTNGIKW